MLRKTSEENEDVTEVYKRSENAENVQNHNIRKKNYEGFLIHREKRRILILILKII